MIKNKLIMIKTIKNIAISVLVFCAPLIAIGAEATNTATSAGKMEIDINFVLMLIAVFLLIPFYFTSKTFLFAAKDYFKKHITSSKTISILFLLFASQFLFAQTAALSPPPSDITGISNPKNLVTIALILIIALEFIFIIYFSLQTNKFLNPTIKKVNVEEAAEETSAFQSFWDKINSFRPISEEGDIDTGHSYDGIRELNNITPPWFIVGFVASIIFAIVYLYVYHVSESAPLQIEEYNIEMANAELEKSKYLATQANSVDESSVTLLAGADLESGKTIFIEKCAACHAASGGSMPGGVGPNLTDDYWLHGGDIKDIFKTIKYGWPEKGMISWQDQLSPLQIAQLSSFIFSLKGANPPNAKEPQGELYSASVVPTDTSKTNIIDTSNIKIDTSIKK
jgi:cytochrome c oxidase cbb3-type subunit 3